MLCLRTVCVCVSSVLMIVCVLLFSSRRRLGRRLASVSCFVSCRVTSIASQTSAAECVSRCFVLGTEPPCLVFVNEIRFRCYNRYTGL